MRTDVEPTHTSADFLVTRSGLRADFFSADEVRTLDRETSRELAEIVDWSENFLGKPSGLVGRAGNVCPFVPQAMVLGRLKFAVIALNHRGMAAVAEIEELIDASREYFVAKEKAQGKIDIFGSLVLIFPGISKDEASRVIDPSQRKFKPTFVKQGLMLGEFHPLSPTPGLRSAAFRPLRSPIPLLAMRHMVESDVDFLISPFDPPATRVESIKAYLHYLGPSLSMASLKKAKEALKVAEAELLADKNPKEC